MKKVSFAFELEKVILLFLEDAISIVLLIKKPVEIKQITKILKPFKIFNISAEELDNLNLDELNMELKKKIQQYLLKKKEKEEKNNEGFTFKCGYCGKTFN